MKRKTALSILSLAFLGILFLSVVYTKVFYSPNSYLFSNKGDGIKNYFTYVSQVKDSSFLHSKMMNYPYGEIFIYTDCHPVLTVILKPLIRIFPGLSDYLVGIINFSMLFSLVLTSVFIYLILKEFKTNNLLAMVAAFSISVLSPQVFRYLGHLSLSYSVFIPLTWFLLLRYLKSEHKLKWAFFIFSNIVFWFFIHAYLGMILVSFIALYYVVDFFFFNRKEYLNIQKWICVFLQTFAPLLLFWTFVILIDTHQGRTNNPFGFFTYLSNPGSVFLPHHAPLKGLFSTVFSYKQIWEGWAYIGIVSVVAIFIFLINRLVGILKSKPIIDDSSFFKNKVLISGIIASVLVLLLSFGYPFIFKNGYLLNKLSIVKSFRGIGRFAWVFYYVITISSVVYIHSILLKEAKQFFKLFLALLITSLFFVEGLFYHIELRKEIAKTPNYFSSRYQPEYILSGLAKIDAAHYQGIIPLPYYHIGSENYGTDAPDQVYIVSMLFSYYSGIPLMSNYSTRTSIPESKTLMQMFSPEAYDKVLENYISSNKPFLILKLNENLGEYETRLFAKGELIDSNNVYSLYSLTLQELFQKWNIDEIISFRENKGRLIEKNGFLVDSIYSNSLLIYEPFEDLGGDIYFRENGAFTGQQKDYNVIKTIAPNVLQTDKVYSLSFWMYNGGENYGQDALNSIVFVQAESENGNVEWIAQTPNTESFIIDKDWSLIELDFTISDSSESISIFIKGDDQSKKSFVLDDLLIKEKGATIFRVEIEKKGVITDLFKNNHKIKSFYK